MKDLAIILGIRPDVIRASRILKLLNNQNSVDFDFIWSGQHYSENMKDVFNQLDVPKPNFEFQVNKSNDSTIVSSTIENRLATLKHINIKPQFSLEIQIR